MKIILSVSDPSIQMIAFKIALCESIRLAIEPEGIGVIDSDRDPALGTDIFAFLCLYISSA